MVLVDDCSRFQSACSLKRKTRMYLVFSKNDFPSRAIDREKAEGHSIGQGKQFHLDVR